ncbi:septal ring lytic transglycosylase RlpA family protein [Schlegelella sp. S2-27]|uniref:Endolytic peptidoglycan transglycosylase RlpA n=1 Tax=Caldimonas mangrovi TaxID=2944811 RepID=A0ABT0YSN9_9BURK|nr:septal ring lytic transglycosylase RlpA family protein [Caldimonas mangrovi]MCM5681757.1 septal ring lytic transglycosylase RlpA family protein [Caldimonas mangrovi]
MSGLPSLLRAPALVAVLCAAAVLAGCGSAPKRGGGYYQDDGPGENPPADAASAPDAEPRVEPFGRGTLRPYTVLGRSYVPITEDRPFRQRGIASWYGRKFHGKRTASGEIYDMYEMTAAHPTLPIPSYVRVRHVASGREVIVRINDRGPFHGNRIIDLSYAAALKLGFVRRGSAEVEIERITHEEIRAGTWRERRPPTPAPEPVRVAQPPPVAPVPVSVPPAPPAAAPAPAVAAALPADSTPASAPAIAPAAGFWVQLGAFRQREGADSFRRRVAGEADWLSPLLAVFDDAPLFRLQAGPYATRDEAFGIAERVRDALKLVPVVVER